MDESDDEDPLLLVPRSERRIRSQPSRSPRSEIEPIVEPPFAEIVPTSDSEEALEERVAREGWQVWYETVPSGIPLWMTEGEEHQSRHRSGMSQFVVLVAIVSNLHVLNDALASAATRYPAYSKNLRSLLSWPGAFVISNTASPITGRQRETHRHH